MESIKQNFLGHLFTDFKTAEADKSVTAEEIARIMVEADESLAVRVGAQIALFATGAKE